MNSRSIVLTGFMGTGKTAVGHVIAEKLAREFVDLDAVIEARESQSVSAIFETLGEAHFRALEAALCAELGARDSLVIATGGGALVDPTNQARFAEAFIVCLDATVDDILARVGRTPDRPLLAGDDPRARVEALLAARREAYAQIRIHMSTSGKTVEQVAGEIIASFVAQDRQPQLVVPTPDGAYPIFVGVGLLTQTGQILTGLATDDRFSSRCAVITNSRVGPLYAACVVEALRAASFYPYVVEIPDGERFKTLDTARAVYDQLADAQLDRRSPVLALGGGVVGDLAGFAAATFLRGVPFVQLPTTLLAMVDASIGGKVAVDHPRGKNLVGAFKQPFAILADRDTLATLPVEEWRAGMAEVIKHAVIGDVGLFGELEIGRPKGGRLDARRAGSWIERAMQVKAHIVARDPFEQNERARLNLGHTFGHALEKLSNYELRHGDAVAIGLVCATRLAAQLGLAQPGLAIRVENLVRQIGLPTRVPRELSAETILDAMTADKKRVNGKLRFVLPRALGDVVTVDDVASKDVVWVIESNQ